MTILYFILSLGVLIFIHELGHFIFAKRAGVRVDTFSLGFGPRLFGVKRGETDYRISLLPLGGYVKMLGEDPADAEASDPRSFAVKSLWARTKVIIFGPLMNLFLSLAIMPLVFMLGRAEPVFFKEAPVLSGVRTNSPAAIAGLEIGDRIISLDGAKVQTWEEVMIRVMVGANDTIKFAINRNGRELTRDIKVGEMAELKGGYVGVEPMLFMGNDAKINGVKPGGPAAEAGILPGDKVVSFAGKNVLDWIDLAEKVNGNGGAEALVTVEREGRKIDLKVAPAYSEEFKRWLIGISQDRKSNVPMIVKKYGFADSVVMGTKENVKLVGLTFDVLKRLVTGKLSIKVLGGPIIIAKVSAAAASSGLSDFLYFLAFLSVQLSVLNFLPIPVLDGGQLVYFAIEAVRKKPLGTRARSIADQVGFVLLVSLMLFVTYNDVENVWGIKALLKKIF